MKWIKQSVLNGLLLGGTWLNMGSALTAEVAGLAGYDWALIDLEHGSGDCRDLHCQLLALEPSSTAAIVRVPSIDPTVFKNVLDLGPAGLMIPNVQDAEAARRLVSFARIPPDGVRGAATSTRASRYGFGYHEYLATCNANLLLVAQIESLAGVANADAIAGVDGIDVLFVGPTDLGIALGVQSDIDDPEFRKALVGIAAAASKHNKAAGVLIRNAQEAPVYQSLGYTFLSMGTDRGMIYKGMQDNMAHFRTLKEGLIKSAGVPSAANAACNRNGLRRD